ncbi:MAG TPA: hypothetical protein VN026_09565 [Bacteroidia bacterium]|jgi:hypothetical protein|nr:hypothetical protein [Bacteroidia bacterium]
MKTLIYKAVIGAFLSVLIFSSCKKKEQAVSPPVPGNEFVTTVKWRFQNTANAADTLWATWKQLNPGGTNPPDTSQAICNLKKSSTYKLTVHFYDETKSPVLDLTDEIGGLRANYHLYFFFQSGGIVNHVTITSTDHDTNNPPLPIGLQDNVVTDATVCNGRLEGVLRHQPNAKNGTFAPGSTDNDVTMRVNIN